MQSMHPVLHTTLALGHGCPHMCQMLAHEDPPCFSGHSTAEQQLEVLCALPHSSLVSFLTPAPSPLKEGPASLSSFLDLLMMMMMSRPEHFLTVG